MEIFRKTREESGLAQCTNYSKIDENDMLLHKITDQEYKAVPKKNISILSIILSIPGLFMLLEAIFFIYCMKDVIDSIKNHAEMAWFGLYIMPMVFLFLGVFTFIAMQDKFVRRVTKNSLVSAGEVLETRVHRGRRDIITDADHVIALHGTHEIVVINDKKPIYAGNAVLIVKTRELKFVLISVNKKKVDLYYKPDESEIARTYKSPNVTYDYSDYSQICFRDLKRNSISEYEYDEIPELYRSVAPLHHGYVSGFWVFFIIITCGLFGLLVYGFIQHSAELFFGTLVGLLCAVFLDWIFSIFVLYRPLPFNSSYYIDCVVTYKANVSGHCYINAIFPEDKQYIERLVIEADQFDDLVENVPVRIYFRNSSFVAQYIRRI